MRMDEHLAQETELQILASEDLLARRIKVEREKRGWSQERLAARVEQILGGGFPQSAVSKIERDKGQRRAITVDEALAFSRVFEIPLLELLVPAEAVANSELRRVLVEFLETGRREAEVRAESRKALERAAAALEAHPDLHAYVQTMASSKEQGAEMQQFLADIQRLGRGASDG